MLAQPKKYRFEKTYLDEMPALDKAVRDWLETVDLPSDCLPRDIERIDCRSRDGFIANSWNHGGYDKDCFTDLSYLHGTGYDFGLGKIAEDAIKYSLELAAEHCAKENITEDEDRYTVEDEYMHDTVWLGVRCMYEGQERGIHTLMIYCGGNISEYYGPHGKGSSTLAEFKITFRTAASLRRQLQRLTKKIEGVFA